MRPAMFVLVAFLVLAISGSAKTIYVPDDYAKIQEAIDAAVNGDTIIVRPGTYVENITLKNGVGLYGGFAGDETVREQRDWNVNETILDGNQSGSVVICPEDATNTTIIDGFTVQNGSAGLFLGWVALSTTRQLENTDTLDVDLAVKLA